MSHGEANGSRASDGVNYTAMVAFSIPGDRNMSIRRGLNAPLKNYQAAEKLPDLSSVYKHDRVRSDAQPLAGKAEMLFGGGLNAY